MAQPLFIDIGGSLINVDKVVRVTEDDDGSVTFHMESGKPADNITVAGKRSDVLSAIDEATVTVVRGRPRRFKKP